MTRRLATLAGAAVAALVATAAASAHAHMSPPLVLAKQSQVFTLAVPTEQEGATTTSVVMTPPPGFSIDSFIPSPGWKRHVAQSGSGEDATITKVTWTGGHVPTGEDSAFSFLARTDASKTYVFKVRQTYSDGTVVDWTGPESSDTPAPTIEAASSLGGGGGGSSTLAIVGIVLGALGLVVGGTALLTRGGGSRPLA
ncbi:MAG TPA: DUF1775 domain-containing protein [Gaiellaceae bacterium]|jgi:uncharacterized protein YcnI